MGKGNGQVRTGNGQVRDRIGWDGTGRGARLYSIAVILDHFQSLYLISFWSLAESHF